MVRLLPGALNTRALRKVAKGADPLTLAWRDRSSVEMKSQRQRFSASQGPVAYLPEESSWLTVLHLSQSTCQALVNGLRTMVHWGRLAARQER